MSRSNAERIQFSIIIPVLNESQRIEKLLVSLRKQTSNFETEIIVVDGGSEDDTLQRARVHCDHAVQSPRGRARQQNFGANIAMGDTLVFLHADTTLPADAFNLIANALNPRCSWGRFDVTLDSHDVRLRLVATMMNLRSRSTGIATGDQCIFVTRCSFIAVGGFPDQALMEDIEISKRLKRVSSPACLRAKVCTSARRWETHGIFRTIALMWWLRLAYWLGVSPAALARWYGDGKSEAAR